AAGATMIAVALVGTVVNATSALLFLRDNKRDLNVESAFLHLASDAVLSAGVAVTGAVILFTRWYWLDPLVSIVLALAILAGTWSLMARSMNLMLDAVPEGIDPAAVKAFLAALPGVVEVHDLHIWAMSTTETALTAHLVMPGNSCAPSFLADACRTLQEKFAVAHATLQIDPEEAEPCALAPDEIV
ncbi:MAG TPA: cation diffusion facilitator family transporter, partial [Polyangiaceae bacterium]